MLPETEILLQGPRGRRLCLELAMEADQHIRRAVFDLGFNLDPGAGRSRVMLTLGSGEPEPVPAASSIAGLADRIAALELGVVDAAQAGHALQRAVDTARYWQEPDGEDVLAATQAVTDSLSHIAHLLSASPATQWWRRAAQPSQWAIDWRTAEDPAPLPKSPHHTLAEWARRERAAEILSARERPKDPRANFGGEWWSIPHGLVQTTGGVPDGLNLVEDSLGWEYATVFPVGGTGRILEIQSTDDWVELCREFPLEVSASRRHDWFRTTGRHGRWVIPDWERVATRWDAIHLPVDSYLRLAGRALPVEDTATVIAGWDPDSTIWLTDVARESGEPRQFWHRPPNEDHWTLVSMG